MAYKRPEPVMVSTSTVFAAAAAAHRVNRGDYIKGNLITVDGEPPAFTSNRELVSSFLAEPDRILKEDTVLGESVRTHFKGLTFKMLGGKMLNEFEQKALQYASSETMDERGAAIVAALPSAYARDLKRRSVEDLIAECLPQYVGPVGSKVTVTGEVVRAFYSQQWNTWFVTVVTTDNLAVFFSFGQVEVGSKITVAGKVKAHRPGFQTQLNYVKFIGQ